jgi:hypothetical protein
MFIHAEAQNLEIGLMGGGKSTWLFNKNISDDGDEQDYAAGWGYSFGFTAANYFNGTVGMELDFLYTSHAGNYTGVIDSGKSYDSNVRLTMYDFPLLFKARGESGGFFEIGPEFTIVSKAIYNSTGRIFVQDSSMTDYYSSNNISVVMGFGIDVDVNPRWAIRTGLRFEWGLKDLKGIDGMGNALNNPFLYKEQNPTNLAAGALYLGVTYRFLKDDGVKRTPDSGAQP